MKKTATILPALLAALAGCDAISPFVGEDLKDAMCDRDRDGLARPGWCGGEDCDDWDEGVGVVTWHIDSDQDGYGTQSTGGIVQCAELSGYASRAGDCDDEDATINPSAQEVCDDIDNDCDEILNELDGDIVDGFTRYQDLDGDLWGSDISRTQCEEAPGWVESGGDCDDANAAINPLATELCKDGIDNDCDGEIDTDAENVPWYADNDEDGYGDEATTLTDCAPPTGYVGNATDCDDLDNQVNPGVEEVCNNGVDDNCDGSRTPCEWSGTISLADADATIDGVSSAGFAGFALANAGDINGDGYDDILMSAPQIQEIYVFFGPVGGELDTSMADITFEGPSGSYAGMAVTGACDLQGDGTADDLLIGGPYDSDNGSEAGAVWILHGPLSSGSYDLDIDANEKIVGDASSHFGASVACGDQDADGDDDVLVGASHDDEGGDDAGAAYIGNSPVTSLLEMFKLSGEAMNDSAGIAAVLVDTNGDGFADPVIGAHQEDEIDSSAGAVYIFLGPITDSHSLGDANAKLLGENASDFAGRTISGTDLDADGDVDLLIGAYGFNSDTGAAYIVYGPITSGSLGSHPRLDGEAAGDNAGLGLAQPCDFDGDGYIDLFVGAWEESSVEELAGGAYLFDSVTASASLATSDVKLVGEALGDRAGFAMATLDANADGFCDLLVGAYLTDVVDVNAGTVYLINGLGY